MEHLQNKQKHQINLMTKPLEERIKESIIQAENGHVVSADTVKDCIEKRYGIKR